MQCKVIRPFNLNGVVRMPGQIVEMDFAQAGRMRRMGLVGQAVTPPAEYTVAPEPERAVKKPAERRRRKAKKEQKAENDVADLGDPSGD